MKVGIEQITEALSELVRLKDYKDKYGKDERYVVEQPLAWNKARVVLRQANEAKTSALPERHPLCKGDGIDHCDYYTTIDCDECKYGGGLKDPETKCNQMK